MSSVYKKSRDRKRPGASWYITFVNEHGRRQTVKGCPDKAATEAMARKLESEAELRRRGVIDPKADHLANHEARTLVDHLNDFHNFLVGKGTTVKHADLTRNRVARLIDLARARHVSDMVPSRVQASLRTVRDTGVSLRSVHHYTRAAKAFSRWLWRDGRARDDALAHLTSPNPDADRRHERRALTPGEATRLIEAAVHGPVVEGLNGTDRAMLYRLAMGTGFRAGELGSLTPECFDLDGNPPTVTVRAAYSKRRRDDEQPIRTDLANILRSWLASKAPRKPVFGELSKYTSRMMQRDLKAAGVAYKDASDRFADFHALRHTYISALAMSGAPVKVVQSLARHSTPTLTLGTYAHVGVFDQTAALDALPDLTPSTPDSEVQLLAATGTYPTPLVYVSDPESAAHGQRAADGTGLDEAGSGGSADSKGVAGDPTLMLHNPSETTGLDGPSRTQSASDSGGGGIRTHGYAERINGFQDRPDQPLWHPSHSLADLVDDLLGDEDGDVDRHRDGDRVAGAGIDFHDLSFMADSQLRVVRVFTQLADKDVLKLAPKQLDDVREQVVSQRARGGQALHAAIDAGRLEDADHDGKRALAVHLLEEDDLLLVVLVDDDPREFHLQGHGGRLPVPLRLISSMP